MKLSFLGAADKVAGSCFPAESEDARFLVDCGMAQGGREARECNQRPFAFDPASIDFVVLASRPHRSQRAAAQAHPLGLCRAHLHHRGQRRSAGRDAARPRAHPAGRCRAPGTAGGGQCCTHPALRAGRCVQDPAATAQQMAAIIEQTLFERGGNVAMPAFAVGRTQEVIHHLHRLMRAGRPRPPQIFVDSPMATEATRITREHLGLFDPEARRIAAWHAEAPNASHLHFTAGVADSMAFNRIRPGPIIISARGMCEAGRIRHHLRHHLPRRECSVVMPGFQAQGTLGRRLLDGARQVRLFDDGVPVRAAIHAADGLPAHADRTALLGWARAFRKPPAQTFVVHGEPMQAQALVRLPGRRVSVPSHGQSSAWPDVLTQPL